MHTCTHKHTYTCARTHTLVHKMQAREHSSIHQATTPQDWSAPQVCIHFAWATPESGVATKGGCEAPSKPPLAWG